MELTTTHDAQRAMKIFFKAEVDEHDRKEWLAITGQSDITTKVLWDTIRGSEGVAGLSGSGAAVSASPQPRCPNCKSVDVTVHYHAKKTPHLECRNCDLQYYGIEIEFFADAPAPASPGPRPVCPKCGAGMGGAVYSSGDDCESITQYEATCMGKEPHTFKIPHEFAIDDFAQFFPASLNGEKRAPDKFSQKWCEDAFVILAGLKEAVVWELAPSIMKEINRLVESVAATTQGTPEGK